MTRLRSCGSSTSALFWGDFPGQIGFNKDLKPFLKSTLTMIYNSHTLHNKYSFSLRISSINMTKSAVFCGLSPMILPKSYWFKNHTNLLIKNIIISLFRSFSKNAKLKSLCPVTVFHNMQNVTKQMF